MNVSDKANTLRAQDHGHPPVICIEGHIIDRETSQNGCGWREGGAHTLNATDRHAVCFPVDSVGHDIRSTQFSRGGAATP